MQYQCTISHVSKKMEIKTLPLKKVKVINEYLNTYQQI